MKTATILTIHPRSLTPEGIQLEGEVEMTALEIPEEDRIGCPDPLRFSLHASLAGDAILVQGEMHTVLRCRCDRCLKYYDLPLDLNDVCIYFKNIDTDTINLTEDLRQDILLGFPQHCRCGEDCRGLCPNCGQNLNVRDCGCQQQTATDDAWGMLDQIEIAGERTSEDE
jgi:uncharacterized protein